ncbi:MAG TPA: glycoside hydrolase family 3 C-terminal domain-containing protein, partial [Balneolales bacterium]|nr:glycoside hydrolase family 3 C-terminal domain-containing protein [Balneolales bacterium]
LVTGPDATLSGSLINGYGPSGVNVTTVLDGIKSVVAKRTRVTYVKGPNVRDKDFPESDIMSTSLSKEEKSQIQKAVKAARHSDVAIVVVGENNRTVGEGRSRVSLNLPGHQLALVKAVYKTGTPTVVVLLNGQPLSINWINANVPSILEAWFPGAKAGDAIAKSIFGEYNPGGKLPITFPKTVGQVPINFPYMPASQGKSNSRHARARVVGPLYPFGYGLSYTTFKYSDLTITPDTQKTGGRIKVSLNVKNTGERKGDEVVQLYLHEETTPVITPVEVLRGFKRVTIEPGQTQHLTFELTPKDLQIYNKNLEPEVVPGTFHVMIGSSSEDIRLKGEFEISGRIANKAFHM